MASDLVCIKSLWLVYSGIIFLSTIVSSELNNSAIIDWTLA
jgi:hypothetical protein